jgi:hypothetical protein
MVKTGRSEVTENVAVDELNDWGQASMGAAVRTSAIGRCEPGYAATRRIKKERVGETEMYGRTLLWTRLVIWTLRGAAMVGE